MYLKKLLSGRISKWNNIKYLYPQQVEEKIYSLPNSEKNKLLIPYILCSISNMNFYFSPKERKRVFNVDVKNLSENDMRLCYNYTLESLITIECLISGYQTTLCNSYLECCNHGYKGQSFKDLELFKILQDNPKVNYAKIASALYDRIANVVLGQNNGIPLDWMYVEALLGDSTSFIRDLQSKKTYRIFPN